MSQPQASLGIVDYVLATIILLVPVGIGIGYAIKDANKATRTEYLLGGRQMSIIPVATSLFVTFQSSISLIGVPSEVCYYGFIYILYIVGFTSSYVIGYFTIVPLMYPLKITSIYEYLKMRYNSELVLLLSATIGVITTMFYMAVALLSPALALEATAGVPLWMSIAVIGAVGTLYTALGGIKSVIWTDVFQTVIIFIGILAMIIKACIVVGGMDEVWQRSLAGERLDLQRFSPDPRIRHSVWSLLIGMCSVWLVNAFNQSTLQRICCTKSLREAKIVFMLNVPMVMVYHLSLGILGLAIFAYLSFRKCDPMEAGYMDNLNQLAPFFVLHSMKEEPGFAGLYISTLCCGSLSTLSSGINAMAANTVEDLLRRPLRNLREATVTFIAKLLVLFYGALIIGLAYLASSLDGPVGQMALSTFGCFGSPILGIFLMGGMVPWANKIGALVGASVALVFNFWVTIGSLMHGSPIKKLPSPGTQGCDDWVGLANSSATYIATNSSLDLGFSTQSTTGLFQNVDNNSAFFLYEISYEWYSLMGTLVCLVVGLGVSYATNRMLKDSCSESTVSCNHGKYIFPFLRNYWGMDMDDSKKNDHSLLNTDKHVTKNNGESLMA